MLSTLVIQLSCLVLAHSYDLNAINNKIKFILILSDQILLKMYTKCIITIQNRYILIQII